MATISFRSPLTLDTIPSNSGIGFYGASFGSSVPVGAFQTLSYISDSGGTIQGEALSNIGYVSATGASVNGNPTINVLNVPNFQATLNINFSNATPVQAQNAMLWLYDRNNINNPPSSVLPKIIENIHTSTSQGVAGSGSTSWQSPSGTGVAITLAQSPGPSGAYALNGTGQTTPNTTHDWFVSLSFSPSTIGSKYFALFFEVEYL